MTTANMTKVNAYKIIDREQWLYYAFGEEQKDTAVVVSKYGKKRAVESIDDEPWEVGDWVVLWPIGTKSIYKPDDFEKHFIHLDGIRYETKLS